jgi:hypothetical protein
MTSWCLKDRNRLIIYVKHIDANFYRVAIRSFSQMSKLRNDNLSKDEEQFTGPGRIYFLCVIVNGPILSIRVKTSECKNVSLLT